MTPEAARAFDLLRLADEVAADMATLDAVAEDCVAQRQRLVDAPEDRGTAALVAVSLHRYYTGIENIFERVDRTLGAVPPASPTWHRDLLWGASRPLADARPAVITAKTARLLEQLLSFRHFFRHAYSVELDAARLVVLVDTLAAVHGGARGELATFGRFLRSLAESLSALP